MEDKLKQLSVKEKPNPVGRPRKHDEPAVINISTDKELADQFKHLAMVIGLSHAELFKTMFVNFKSLLMTEKSR